MKFYIIRRTTSCVHQCRSWSQNSTQSHRLCAFTFVSTSARDCLEGLVSNMTGYESSGTRGDYPPTTKALFLPTSPFSLPSEFPLSPPFPSSPPIVLPSPPLDLSPLAAKQLPWNQLGSLVERCKLSHWSLAEASTDIDYGVFWEGKTHLTAIIWIFVYWNLLNF